MRWITDLIARLAAALPDWFLKKFPGNVAFRDGYVDGMEGKLPSSTDEYYLDGHRLGTADRQMW